MKRTEIVQAPIKMPVKVPTKESARNPDPDVKIRCENCHKEYTFSEKSIIEVALPMPYPTVVEGLLLCPHCGKKNHTYYMSEQLRFQLVRLKKAIADWHNTKTSESFARYETLHTAYKNNFDRDQEKYKKVMELKDKDGAETT